MKNYKGSELEAYGAGINAAYRIDEYEGYEDTPDNPYSEESLEYAAWEDGFGDGTEDLIATQQF